MIKNKLKSKLVENADGEKVETNMITLSWDGRSYTLFPGESINVVDHFNVTKDYAHLLEGRFVQKFPSAIAAIDTDIEMKRVEAERIAQKKKDIEQAKTFKEMRALIKNEKSDEVIQFAMDRIESAQKNKPSQVKDA
jgi:hypothetical protein